MMNSLKSDKLIIEALKGKTTYRPPLWLMRQAGRYLPEYMAIRAKHDTLSMFKSPEIASVITLQPLRRFELDAAIVYADILLLPDALGMKLEFATGEGPRFKREMRTKEDVEWLEQQAKHPSDIIQKLSYVAETLLKVKPQLAKHQALIGFAGAPWTVACYLIQGQSHRGNFDETKLFMFHHPELLHRILKVITLLTIQYITLQIQAGAEVIQLFESWGGLLTPDQYREFAKPYVTEILESVKTQNIPTIHFVNESGGILHDALQPPCNAFGVDWRQDLSSVGLASSNFKRALQGNLDPMLLRAPQSLLLQKADQILEYGSKYPHGYIFNLGHGISKETPVENVAALCNKVSNFKR